MVIGIQAAQELADCCCAILTRFSLPCRHYLRPLWDTGSPIPRSFLHQRWWLKGPTIHEVNWVPSAELVQARCPSPRQQNIFAVLHGIAEARDRLQGDERGRFEEQIRQTGRALEVSAQEKETMALFPIQNPDAIEKRQWRKKKDTANARGMTATEIVDANNQKAERGRRQVQKDVDILQTRTQQQQAQEAREKVSKWIYSIDMS